MYIYRQGEVHQTASTSVLNMMQLALLKIVFSTRQRHRKCSLETADFMSDV
jgi:hypothetical protein